MKGRRAPSPTAGRARERYQEQKERNSTEHAASPLADPSIAFLRIGQYIHTYKRATSDGMDLPAAAPTQGGGRTVQIPHPHRTVCTKARYRAPCITRPPLSPSPPGHRRPRTSGRPDADASRRVPHKRLQAGRSTSFTPSTRAPPLDQYTGSTNSITATAMSPANLRLQWPLKNPPPPPSLGTPAAPPPPPPPQPSPRTRCAPKDARAISVLHLGPHHGKRVTRLGDKGIKGHAAVGNVV